MYEEYVEVQKRRKWETAAHAARRNSVLQQGKNGSMLGGNSQKSEALFGSVPEREITKVYVEDVQGRGKHPRRTSCSKFGCTTVS